MAMNPAKANQPLLQVENLRIEIPGRRGTLTAVNDISFAIGEGEVLGVVGESGAGKSLTGSAVIGLLEPPCRIAGGRIVFDGKRIDNLPYEKLRRIRGRHIGMVFQDPLTSLNPLYTVGRQLTETILTHTDMNEKGARKRAIELLQEVGIPAAERRVDQYPHEFSGGMRQRVVIALALPLLPMSDGVAGVLRRLVSLVLIGALGWFAILVVRGLTDVTMARHRIDVEDNLEARKVRTRMRVLRQMATMLITLITVSAMLMTFPQVRTIGVSLFASAGVAGIVVGLEIYVSHIDIFWVD